MTGGTDGSAAGSQEQLGSDASAEGRGEGGGGEGGLEWRGEDDDMYQEQCTHSHQGIR